MKENEMTDNERATLDLAHDNEPGMLPDALRPTDIETSTRDIEHERLALLLRKHRAVRGIAQRYGTFNDAYYDQWAEDILRAVRAGEPSE